MVARQWWKHVVGSASIEEGTNWNEACVPGYVKVAGWKKGEHFTVEQLYDYAQRNPRYLPIVRSVDSEGNIVKAKVKAVWKSGVKPVYRVVSELGLYVDTTLDHRFLTPDGYKPLSELGPGDYVMMNGTPAYRDRQWLEEMYVRRGLSQAEIAAIAGCSVHTIRKWVREFGLQQDQVERLIRWVRTHGPFGKGETAETNESIRRRTEAMRAALRGRPATLVEILIMLGRVMQQRIMLDTTGPEGLWLGISVGFVVRHKTYTYIMLTAIR